MQEAMLACIDITKPTFDTSPAKLAACKFPMIWLCEMGNSVIGEKGKLLEYWHLIANPKTRATWTHSYGNELGGLAQGMPSQAKGTDMIFFIPWHMVPKERAKDVMYSLITCLIRPEKIEEPNRTRLVAGGDRVHYSFNVRNADCQLTHHKAAHQQRDINTRHTRWTSRISICACQCPDTNTCG
jgi:hypothetical protein